MFSTGDIIDVTWYVIESFTICLFVFKQMFIEALQLLFLFTYCSGPHTRTKSTFSLSLKGIIIVAIVTVKSIKDTWCTQTKLCFFRGYQTVVDGSCVCKRAHYAKMRYQIAFHELFLQKTPTRITSHDLLKISKSSLKHFDWNILNDFIKSPNVEIFFSDRG